MWNRIKSFRKYLFTKSCCERTRDFVDLGTGDAVPEVGRESDATILGVVMFGKPPPIWQSVSVSVSVSRSVSVADSPSVAVGVVYKSEASLAADSLRLCDILVCPFCDGVEIGIRAAKSFFLPYVLSISTKIVSKR